MAVRTWIEEVVEFSKVMTNEEFKLILSRTDLECQKCGTCCVIPGLPYVDKLPNVRCQHLKWDNKCELHGEKKPQGCQEFPHMDKEWLCSWRIAPPRVAVWFCHIIRSFWREAYKYYKDVHLIHGGS